ncbi:hypothetical protein RRG08_049615 [Elysia crispata]|uniref:Uncharacterized protein n=1 Tax=Elysia crispata TaxID=231223 RepID=A0AAE1AUX1_9GAST|nr:hypothetical protein RRG08_049615 [Elysia crispata]
MLEELLSNSSPFLTRTVLFCFALIVFSHPILARPWDSFSHGFTPSAPALKVLTMKVRQFGPKVVQPPLDHDCSIKPDLSSRVPEGATHSVLSFLFASDTLRSHHRDTAQSLEPATDTVRYREEVTPWQLSE